MKYHDITPDHLKCPAGDCPFIHRSEDGSKYRIRGDLIDETREETIEIDARMIDERHDKLFGKILALAKRGIEATEFGMPRASIQHFERIIAVCGEAGYRIEE